MIASIAHAQTRWGSECGLTDMKDETWVEISKYQNLALYSEGQIRQLATVTKQQVIITAKEFAKASEEKIPINNTLDAVNYLKPNQGPYISNFLVNGEEYTEVLSYPGDNPVGMIFKRGSTVVVATNNDDSIECR
jgi:hypothetical protein